MSLGYFQPLLDLDLEPTAAMLRGEQRVFQCAQCGTVVVQSGLAPGRLGACPACEDARAVWWEQSLPLAGLRRRDSNPQPGVSLGRPGEPASPA